MLNPELIKKAFVEGVPEKVTVKALVDAGFAPDKVHIIVSALKEASQKK